MTTCTVHYLGYFSLVSRAQRVFKVMRLEKKYLDEIYDMADVNNLSKKSFGANSASHGLKHKFGDNSSKNAHSMELLVEYTEFSDNIS
jgi:hypothetical protein